MHSKQRIQPNIPVLRTLVHLSKGYDGARLV
jgi:hypothetical protein